MNKELFLTQKQEQILLSGKIGDGNFKRNGSNVYYRETHSVREKEYCKWKHDILIPNISKSGFHITDKRDGQWGFQTINSPTLRYYRSLSISETITKLDKFGLLVLILDDGWMSRNHLMLSTGKLSSDEIDLLLNQYYKEFGIKPHLVGIKRKDISFSDCTEPLFPYFKSYFPNNIDVFEKKVKPFRNKFKV